MLTYGIKALFILYLVALSNLPSNPVEIVSEANVRKIPNFGEGGSCTTMGLGLRVLR
jgi:hypothetical protein